VLSSGIWRRIWRRDLASDVSRGATTAELLADFLTLSEQFPLMVRDETGRTIDGCHVQM